MAYYKSGKINIPEVTGAIVITVTAVESAEETVVIVWMNGYTVSYTVGQACTPTASANYYTTELIPVEYGKTYTLNLSAAAANPPRFVGVDASGKVTETATMSVGSKQYIWTPSVDTTVGLRLRGYADAFSQVSNVTEMKVS